MSTYVIDSSVAAKWLFREKGSNRAEALLTNFSSFFVPDLFIIEMDSIISKKRRRNELSVNEAPAISKKVRKLPCNLIKYSNIAELAFDISISLPVTIYDACYVATAIEKDGVLHTADQKLMNGLSNTLLKQYVRSIWDK